MNCLKSVGALGAVLIGAATGCAVDADEPATGTASSQIQVAVPASPGDVTAIHVVVTGADFSGSVDGDLVKQPDSSWLGTVLDVPPGAGRTVTAEGFDIGLNNTFEGVAGNVTVAAGKLLNLAVTMKPRSTGPYAGVNTPPHFVALLHPEAILSTGTAALSATADDPDANTQLTYSWSVLQGGGAVSDDLMVNQTPGMAVSTVYTPVSGFTGFAVLQVQVDDGLSTTMTTLPIAIGASVLPVLTVAAK
ncbi:MAG TPA: hypothetical protein VGC42_15730 [Kofleriaceae bacterium]